MRRREFITLLAGRRLPRVVWNETRVLSPPTGHLARTAGSTGIDFAGRSRNNSPKRKRSTVVR